MSTEQKETDSYLQEGNTSSREPDIMINVQYPRGRFQNSQVHPVCHMPLPQCGICHGARFSHMI